MTPSISKLGKRLISSKSPLLKNRLMPKIIASAFIILNRWEEAEKCYLGKLKINAANMKREKIISEETETTSTNNFYLLMLLTSKYTQ